MLIYIYSFTIFGHLTTGIGRYAWMTIVWKIIIAFPTLFGLWSPVSAAALNIDTSDDIRLGETARDIGDTLSSFLGNTNTNTNTNTSTNTHTNTHT